MSDAPLQDAPNEATLLLAAAAEGDARAAEDLLPLVSDQLRRAAQRQLAGEARGPSHTLSATALVHEVYLKLVGPRQVPWAGQAHFYAAAAEAMRRILLDHARARGRLKRGGGRRRVPLSVLDLAAEPDPEMIVALDTHMRRLESRHPDAAAVVRLRFYAGLTGDQTAETLGCSPRQVDRHWSFGRAWLYRELCEEAEGSGGGRID